MKYINVGIDEELHKRIKIESAQRGISITKYVTDCLGSIGSTKGIPEKKPQKEAHLQTYPEPTPPKELFSPAPKPKKK